MISRNEIKMVRSLSQKKFRDELGLFVAEGEKLVDEAVRSDFKVVNLYKRDEIGEEAMSRITNLSSPSPSLAVIEKPSDFSDNDIDDIIGKRPLALALDSLRDPGNVGTIIRLADWFGIDVIFASKDTVDIFNPKVVQATMGAIFRIKFIYCDLDAVCERFISSRMKIFGTFLDGDTIYDKDLDSSGLIVMGSESNGISNQIATKVTDRLFIPPYPFGADTSESLNVAIATAITCSEFRRRK